VNSDSTSTGAPGVGRHSRTSRPAPTGWRRYHWPTPRATSRARSGRRESPPVRRPAGPIGSTCWRPDRPPMTNLPLTTACIPNAYAAGNSTKGNAGRRTRGCWVGVSPPDERLPDRSRTGVHAAREGKQKAPLRRLGTRRHRWRCVGSMARPAASGRPEGLRSPVVDTARKGEHARPRTWGPPGARNPAYPAGETRHRVRHERDVHRE